MVIGIVIEVIGVVIRVIGMGLEVIRVVFGVIGVVIKVNSSAALCLVCSSSFSINAEWPFNNFDILFPILSKFKDNC